MNRAENMNAALEHYMVVSEMARRERLSERRARVLCATGRVIGASRIGRAWVVPRNYVIDPPLDTSRRKKGLDLDERIREAWVKGWGMIICKPPVRKLTKGELAFAQCLVLAAVEAGDWP
jgi:hypothetical protein